MQCGIAYGQRQSLDLEEMDVLLEKEHFSVVNKKDQEGFSIVTSDERLPEVLGFSEVGSFDPTNIPSNMQYWMDCLNYACNEYLAGRASYEEAFGAATIATASVEPLLGDIAWSQEEPYNMSCPQINDTACVTGCGATAIAMIMAYHQYPTTGTGSHTYTTTTNKLKISYDFSSTNFEWNKIRSCYSIEYVEPASTETISSDTDFKLTYSDLVPFATYGGVYVYIDSLWNYSSSEFNGDVQFLLYDKDGNFLESVGERASLTGDYSLPSKSLYRKYPIVATIPNKYDDGDYYLRLAQKGSGDKDWHLCHRVDWSTWKASYTSLKVTKKGEKITIGDYYGYTQYSQDEAKAVGTLLYACGAAIDMDYGINESSATIYGPLSGSIKYLGYDKDAYIGYSEHMTTTMKNEMLISEIDSKRPVFIGGLTSSNTGHAFVADGYRTQTNQTYFHINWGWNGMSNGYFLVTNLNPSSTGTGASDGDNFSNTTFFFCGFKPDDGVTGPQAIGYTKLSCTSSQADAGSSISLTATNLMNITYKPLSGNIYALLQAEDGTEYNAGSFSSVSLSKTASYYSSKQGTVTIPLDIPSGTYKIVLRFSKDQKTWGTYVAQSTPTITVNNITGIIDVIEDKNDGKSYDLYGRSIGKEAEGIIIRNNKLVIEKR